jgi:DNA gyrase subunit B
MEVALIWGGTHVDGFHDGVAAAVTAWARRRALLTAQDAGPVRGAEVRANVGEAVREHLGAWFEERLDQAAAIVDRIIRDRHRE